MPVDPQIDQIKVDLDAVQAADLAEDTAYEAQITALTLANASLTAERDALLAEKASTVADLIAQKDALQVTLVSLDARITALGG